MDQQVVQRTYLGKQPARVLLVDLSPPLDEDVCQGIVTAVEKCLTLVCSLAGPPRLSFFGLYALGTYPEALLPLQHTKGNFHRLQSGLNELMNCFQEYSANGRKASTCIGQGVQEAASVFKRQAHSLLQTSSSRGNWSQYEMTVVTCQMSSIVMKQVEKATKDTDAEHLKKIQILQVSHSDKLLTMDDGYHASSQASITSEHSDNSLNAIVDSITLDFSEVALENYFKEWLHDVSTDSEHLHIILPSDEEQVVLKCDLHERILDPNLVPFSFQYSVHPEIIGMRLNPSASMVRGGGISIPIHKLKVVNRIPLDGVCESVLHGMPLVVKATLCWKLEWDELETNQQNFLSLCQQLHKQSEVLLCQLQEEPQQPARPGGGFRYHIPQPKPRGHFLVLPSNSNSLLIKSVADADLTLPADVSSTETPSPESEAVIENSLNKVLRIEMYNPLLVTSGLSESVAAQLTRSAPSGGLKRKFPPASSSAYNQPPASDRSRGRPGLRNPAPPSRDRDTTYYDQRSAGSRWEMSRSTNNRGQQKRSRYPDERGDNFYSRSTAPFPTGL